MLLSFLLLILCWVIYSKFVKNLQLHTEILVNLAYAGSFAFIFVIFISVFLSLTSLYSSTSLSISIAILSGLLFIIGLANKSPKTHSGFENFHPKKYWRSFCLIIIVGIIYVPPSTIVVGGQDPGWYAAAASLLSRTDQFQKKLPAHNVLKNEEYFKKIVFDESPSWRTEYNAGGISLDNDTIVSWYDFQRGPSYIIAYFMKIFGVNWGFIACSILSLFSVLVFYGFCSNFLQPNNAFLAGLLLALCPSEIWFGKASFSEVPSQLFIFLSLVTLLPLLASSPKILDSHAKKITLMVGVGLSAAAAFMMRLDQMTLVAAVLFGFPFLMSLSKHQDKSYLNKNDLLLMLMVQSSVYIAFLFSFWEARSANPIYYNNMKNLVFPFIDNLPLILLVGAAISFVIILFVNNKNFYQKTCDTFQKVIEAPLSMQIFSLLILKLLIWGLIMRLYREPFEMFGSDANHNSGVRTMNEQIFVRLAVMVGLPNLILGFWGAYGLVKNRKTRIAILAFVVIFAFYGSNLLVDQMNSPMLYWATRRYIPVIVPGFILFGTYILMERLPKLLKFDFKLVQAGLVALAFYPMFKWGPYVWEHAEMLGAYNTVSHLSQKLNEPEIVAPGKYVLFSDAEERHLNFTLNFLSNYEVIQVKSLIPKLKTEISQFQGLFKKLKDSGIQPIILVTNPEKYQELDDLVPGDFWHVDAKFNRMDQPFQIWPKRIFTVDHSYNAKVVDVL